MGGRSELKINPDAELARSADFRAGRQAGKQVLVFLIPGLKQGDGDEGAVGQTV